MTGPRPRTSAAIDWLLGGPAPPDPPARVAGTIRAQQRRSEILTSLVQLAVVVGFGTLYFTAPMAQGQVQMLAIVPTVLTLYAGFTLLRLLLAWRDLLPDWLLYLSTVLDMALLVVTIWSFHLEYAQTAAFYLKAPTQLYFFIFIALRALRFEARFVIVAGLAAALGWAALTAFALSGIGGDPAITRDFVVYMTSNATLIGAEVDRIVAMLTVTAILALAIARARRLLVRSVAEREAASDLARFFDPGVASRITGADVRIRAGEGELRDAAIVVVDIRGFTRLSATMAPDRVMALLQEYQARMCPPIRERGGAIDKFLGDGILASFGAVTASRTFAADALGAVEALAAAGRAWNAERIAAGETAIGIGIGVAAGKVLFGAVGGDGRLEYTVIGDAVNLAARLEARNKDEGSMALSDAATFELARAQGYRPASAIERLPQRPIAGLGEPLDLVVLARSG